MKKNFFKFTVSVVTSALILLAAGCSNALTTATVNGSNDSAEKNAGLHSVNLRITASANEGVMKLPAAPSASSRNIHGATLTGDELKFYLFTKKKGVANFDNVIGTVAVYSAKKVSVGEGESPTDLETGEGTITLNLEDSYYDLCLLAVKNTIDNPEYDTVLKAAVLRGETSADLREANATVHFYMIPDGLSGQSTVSINLYTTGWDTKGFTVTSSIIDYATGAPVSANTRTDVSSLPKAKAENDKDYEFVSNAIAPGTYTFQVAFKQDGVTNGKTFYYSEPIDILPNHNITAERAIPEVILKAPVAPSNLYVGFKDPVNNTSDTYYAAFNWEDNSNNETYFQLEILTVPDDVKGVTGVDLKATTTPWGSESNKDKITPVEGEYIFTNLKVTTDGLVTSQLKKLKDDFVGNESQMWYKGSLLKNNKAVAVKLELGKRYLARICAVNDAGSSSYAYVDLKGALDSDLMTKLVGTDEKDKYSKFDDNATSINRYRLAYNLMGGTLTYKDASSTPATGILYEYRTQNSSGNTGEGSYSSSEGAISISGGTYKKAAINEKADVPTADIMNPTCDTTTITSLVSGGKTWKYWKWNDTTSSTSATTKWGAKTIDGVTGDMYYSPKDYTEFRNLILEACYSTDSAGVTINQHDIWNIENDSINVSASGDGVVNYTKGTRYFTFDASKNVSDITFSVGFTPNQKALSVKYDSVMVSVIKNSSQTVVKTFPMTYDSTSNAWNATYGMSDLAQSKYTIKFEAQVASHASDKYSGVYENSIVMEIIEP